MKKFFVVTDDKTIMKRRPFSIIESFANIVKKPEDATDILVISGDGGMLSAINNFRDLGKPFCGLNIGHTGFLMNKITMLALREIAADQTVAVCLKLLECRAFSKQGEIIISHAFNDFYFERAGSQTAKIKITVDRKVRFSSLICDGALICTQAGSTAYNASAGGVILPIETEAMVLTGICPAIFHRWRSSLLASDSVVLLEALEIEKRPVRFMCDGREISNITKAEIRYSDINVQLKFAKSQRFREKVLQLQF